MHYLDQRLLSTYTVIHRDCLLPEAAIGTVRAKDGALVDIRDVVVQGMMPSRHVILDAVRFFGLRKPEALNDLLQVKTREVVEEKQLLARKGRRRLFSPVRGIVTRISEGRIIVQVMPELIDLEAGLKGRISQIHPGRGVSIESEGALVQGVWGNNRRVIATLRLEPEGGIESIVQDALEMNYMGAVILTRRPLSEQGLVVMEEQNLAGVIAPSMDSDLIFEAQETNKPILLTEGFGSARLSNLVYNLLNELEGRQVTLDTTMPGLGEARRPEAVINLSTTEAPFRPNLTVSLRPGIRIRVTGAPYLGQTGRVIDLPKTPCLLDNGLRVPCAQVELDSGEKIQVPVANLEYIGR